MKKYQILNPILICYSQQDLYITCINDSAINPPTNGNPIKIHEVQNLCHSPSLQLSKNESESAIAGFNELQETYDSVLPIP